MAGLLASVRLFLFLRVALLASVSITVFCEFISRAICLCHSLHVGLLASVRLFLFLRVALLASVTLFLYVLRVAFYFCYTCEFISHC